ncbi:hypothetical protein HPB48_012859 [Haemaphysalis longicornis]|uniref:CCHC-type domain-containing protein n=1 Tax=Haemaphysalis longicornis TaxID=44386 RepID=A0A9J6GDH5_HAELO|nr:hypothetical protein HPB48_012859 [Haemaphysalis longicornis]
MCLRCQLLGHMRRQCTTPWCRVCRTFGHDSAACVQSYAAKARGKRAEQPLDEFMTSRNARNNEPTASSQAKGVQPAKENERNEGADNVSPPGETLDTAAGKEEVSPDLPLENDAAATPRPPSSKRRRNRARTGSGGGKRAGNQPRRKERWRRRPSATRAPPPQ